eukprot:2900699-Pyramimonas_sp.AAC.1
MRHDSEVDDVHAVEGQAVPRHPPHIEKGVCKAIRWVTRRVHPVVSPLVLVEAIPRHVAIVTICCAQPAHLLTRRRRSAKVLRKKLHVAKDAVNPCPIWERPGT